MTGSLLEETKAFMLVRGVLTCARNWGKMVIKGGQVDLLNLKLIEVAKYLKRGGGERARLKLARVKVELRRLKWHGLVVGSSFEGPNDRPQLGCEFKVSFDVGENLFCDPTFSI